jgi:hypothetical protein
MACPYADFFTASYAVGYILSPAPRAELFNEPLTQHTSKLMKNALAASDRLDDVL